MARTNWSSSRAGTDSHSSPASRPSSLAAKNDRASARQSLIWTGREDSGHRTTLRLRHPKSKLSLDGNLPRDVLASAGLFRREPGGRVAVALRRVRVDVSRTKFEEV